MSSSAVSPLRKAWYKWKALHLPWRKRFLIGLDLQGNTFWEFRDTLSSHKNRMRRIVQYPPSVQYSDLNISPQWHQWLRHTRQDPPSITEQSQDLVRQRNLKILAAQADARWAAKPSFLESPGRARGQLLPAAEMKDSERPTVPPKEINEVIADRKSELSGTRQLPAEKIRYGFKEGSEEKTRKEKIEDPWKQARGGPSEEWQPQTWDGSIGAAKR